MSGGAVEVDDDDDIAEHEAAYDSERRAAEAARVQAAEYVKKRDQILNAAPDLARALVAVEWAKGKCPICREHEGEEHERDCIIDTALTKAGIDDAERRRMRGEK